MRILPIVIAIFFTNICHGQSPWPILNFDTCSFQAIGHRGYSLIYPENTLLSLEEAFKRGAKYCEIDVSTTADDRYVLFHDEHSIYRTTNGKGRVDEITYNELRQLDAGSWKGSHFTGIYVPTLEEAILVAEKYDGHLYLDTKAYRPDLMKLALEATQTAPDRIIPAISDIPSAQAFRALLPNTPWVWYNGGLYPQQLTDDQFYTDCINLGCIAFELSSPDTLDATWTTFETKVHEHGSKVWVFTENSNERALFLQQLHVDGIETDRSWNINQLLCDGIESSFPDSMTTGNWLFQSSLIAKGVGCQLRPRYYSNPTPSMLPEFKKCSQFGIANLNGIDADVMLVPAQDSLNGLLVYTNFAPHDFGTENRYFSVMMDILIPDSSAGKWIALYQTVVSNTNDADLFINPAGGIGITDEYHGALLPNIWYRIVFTIDQKNGVLKKYINGNYIGSNTIFGNRWTVFNSSPRGENQGFLLFSDNDGETAPLYVSALQIRDYVLDSTTIKAFGAPKATGFKIGNADLWNIKVIGAIADSTILDYDAQTYYVLVPSTFNLSACNLSFNLSHGATASISPGSTVNVSSGEYIMQVTSEDALKTKQWKIVVNKQLNTGLSEIMDTYKCSIYPNPTSGNIKIDTRMQYPVSFYMYDMMGKNQLSCTINTNQQAIDISALSAGIYLIKMSNSTGEISVNKLIKE